MIHDFKANHLGEFWEKFLDLASAADVQHYLKTVFLPYFRGLKQHLSPPLT
jgi:hypothetical protein